MEISGQWKYPVEMLMWVILNVKRLGSEFSKSEKEERNVSDSTELITESLHYGIEWFCKSIRVPVYEEIDQLFNKKSQIDSGDEFYDFKVKQPLENNCDLWTIIHWMDLNWKEGI